MDQSKRHSEGPVAAAGNESGSFIYREWSNFREVALPAMPGLTVSWLLRAAIPAAVFYSAVVFGLLQYGASIIDVITDPEIPENQAWYRGLLSNVGIVLWIATGASCMFTAWCRKGDESSVVARKLIIMGGVLSLMLAADDGLMLHDRMKH